MNREEAKELLPIIQAFAEGKIIQFKNKEDNEWTDFLKGGIILSPFYDYRSKPEPKYRPFKTAEECWQEMHKHPDFGWIVSKEGLEFCHICYIFTSASKRLMITLGIDENNSFEADRYFNNFTFTDGEPFGIKEE